MVSPTRLRLLAYLMLELPLLVYTFILWAFPSSLPAKFTIGIAAMLFIPGYLFGKRARLSDCIESIIGLSLILGLLLQVMNLYALYVVDSFVRFHDLDFSLHIVLVTGVETALLTHFVRPVIGKHSTLGNLRLLLKRGLLSVSGIFLISLAGNLYFASFNQDAILPDGALYLDVARYIVSNGAFSSLVVNDAVHYSYQNQVGLSLHVGTSLLYSLFFTIGDVSYQVAKWGAALVGALLVYPVFEIAKLSFGKRAGIIAAAMIAAHPLFRYYSAILYGPEIVSALLAAVSLLLFERAISYGSLRYSILSGIVLFLTSLVWLGDIVPLVGAFALILTFHSYRRDRNLGKSSVQFLAPTFFFGVFLIALLASPNIQLWSATLLMIFVLLMCYRRLRIDNLRHLTAASCVFLFMMQLHLLRFYLFPDAAVYPGAVVVGSRLPFADNIYFIASRLADQVLPSLYGAALPIVLIPGLLSAIRVTRRALIPYSFFLAWVLARLTLLPTQADLFVVTDERFYLSITAVLTVFCVGFLSRATSLTSKTIKDSIDRKLPRFLKSLSSSDVRIAIVAAALLILILGSSLSSYSNYMNAFNNDSMHANGWVPVLTWIQNNTGSSAVLLTTGSPRLWAWFSDRVVVGTHVVVNNSLLPLDQIGPAELVGLISEFSPQFVIFDSTSHAAVLFLPRLYYLYGAYSPGTAFSMNSTSGSITLSTVISSISAVNNGTITLYRVIV